MDLEKYEWHHVGSSYTCAGLVEPKDYDYLAFVPEKDFNAVRDFLLIDGWKQDGNYPKEDHWCSFKKKSTLGLTYNKIVSKDYLWVKRFLEANELCKKLQLVNKNKRIILHEHFLKQ